MTAIPVPLTITTINQNFLVEPLQGPKDTFYYLTDWPEEIYNKSPDSHVYKFMKVLLGENGVGFLAKNLLQARINLEELGLDAFDLDSFFGSPFAFGRIADESLGDNPNGLITNEEWSLIKSQDAQYRNRALDYVNGSRGGNTPTGMQLVAKAGLGHDVEIIENYKYLFDVHSDEPLGLDYFGKTTSTEEMIILPRREIGASEQQVVQIFGNPELPDGGSFYFIYNGVASNNYHYTYTTVSGSTVLFEVPWNGTADHVRLALEAIPQIGPGNVEVTGGPGPANSWSILFKGALANLDVPQLDSVCNLTSTVTGSDCSLSIVTTVGGKESTDEIVDIAESDKYALQQAIDRIRSQITIPTLGEAKGLQSRTTWQQAYSTSEYSEVIRYVTGSTAITWPATTLSSPNNWITVNEEKPGPRVAGDLQYHYTGFHNVSSVAASSNFLLPVGQVLPDESLADYVEPLVITSSTDVAGSTSSFINGIYPTEYKDLPGVPQIRYTEEQFWASLEREGDEYLIISLPFVAATNYVSFEIGLQPITVGIEYDTQDGGQPTLWQPVTPVEPYNNVMTAPATSSSNPWNPVNLTFVNGIGGMIFTRALKITLSRQQSYAGLISIKNLRVGRNL